MGTVALVLLLAWLVTTAIMTFASGRLVSQHDTGAMRRLDGTHLTSPPLPSSPLPSPPAPASVRKTPQQSR